MRAAFEIMGVFKCKSDVSCRPKPRIFRLRNGSSETWGWGAGSEENIVPCHQLHWEDTHA